MIECGRPGQQQYWGHKSQNCCTLSSIINMLKNSNGRYGRHGCIHAECIRRMQKLVSQLIGQAKAGYKFKSRNCVHLSVTVLDELDTKMVPE
jgi:hypothetical protein